MRLKKLEISGFKSFAQRAVLEFPLGISAIVGPNGSGKSNVVDALCWVLGEQSLKNLRSKGGADLIWAGSPKKAAQGKAQVSLYFDNSDHFFPIDFDEVQITRKVFRDGQNEYLINSSQVRLKDIIELLAASKLGLRGHMIINQGSADAILKAQPQERLGTLEDALGLREFQIKKEESQAKLAETRINLEKVEALIGELAPHLRSLKRQTDKWDKRIELANNLSNFENQLFNFLVNGLLGAKAGLAKKKQEAEILRNLKKQELERLESQIIQKENEAPKAVELLKELENQKTELSSQRQGILRELGRLEGLKEASFASSDANKKTLEAVLAIKLNSWSKKLEACLYIDQISRIKEILKSVAKEISLIFGALQKNQGNEILKIVDLEIAVSSANPYQAELEKLQASLSLFEEKEEVLKKEIHDLRVEEASWRSQYLELQRTLEPYRQNFSLQNGKYKDLEIAEEKLRLQEDNIREKLTRSNRDYEEFAANLIKSQSNFKIVSVAANAVTAVINLADLENKIARLRREVGEIGAIDPQVVKEYEETNKRHEFLTSEVGDLKNASLSLENLISELSKKVNDDFNVGLAKINEEFHRHFRLLFEGGQARLSRTDEGIEVNVNIPQKRIRDLNLLSGGERALVASALLFAIVASSPPPFLILDEIDAALDENNASRFSKILKDLALRTQFILVTHNRVTMETAQVLYGITMGDDGVSRLLSLKLEDAPI